MVLSIFTVETCSLLEAHLMHMFWECNMLSGFWNAVLNMIGDLHHRRLPATPQLCVLGILDNLDTNSPTLVSVSRMLFQARKLIAQHWILLSPPTVREYITRINTVIRLEKGLYLKRKASHKFEAILGPWLDAPGLPSQILLKERIRWSAMLGR